MSCSNLTLHVLCSITIHTMMCVIISRKPYQTKQSMADLEISPMIIEKCIFRKNRALAPHERSAVPLGTDHCPVG